MSRTTKLLRRTILLCAVGVLAHLVDAWARQNANIVVGILEIGLLALWVAVDVNETLRGTWKVGPEESATTKAIHLPQYQLLLAVYCVVLAGVAILGAGNNVVSQVVSSPFLVWLVAAPAVATAFVMEYRAEEKSQETR